MIRPWGAVLCCSALLTACEIEPTPRHYFDHAYPAEGERASETEEIRARVTAVAQAIARGEESAALAALAPAPEAYLIAPMAGLELSGRAQIEAMLHQLARIGAVAVEVKDVSAVVGPKGNVAWFVAHLSVPGVNEPDGLRVTGLYLRGASGWQLQQAHLSVGATALKPLPPSPDAAAESPEAGAPPAR